MEQIKQNAPNKMASTSLFLGIFAIVSVLDIYYAVFLGSMSILLACLSRGASFTMPKKARIGFTISSVAIVSSIVITIFGLFFMVELFGIETVMNPEALMKAFEELYTNLLNEMQIDLQTGGSLL